LQPCSQGADFIAKVRDFFAMKYLQIGEIFKRSKSVKYLNLSDLLSICELLSLGMFLNQGIIFLCGEYCKEQKDMNYWSCITCNGKSHIIVDIPSEFQ